MILSHRPRLAVATLAAVLLVSLLATGADARLPRARAYRVGGPITLDTNLLSASGASAWAIDAYLKATTPLPPLGAAFLAAERDYGVNARFLLAAALHESGWGTSYIARVKHNLFGYNAYDRDPGRYATAYATYAANIDATAKFIRTFYLTPGGRWWGGQPTLRSMQQSWSSSGSWGVSVSRMATSIRLASIAGRSIRFAAPVVSGVLHSGDKASVGLGWQGAAVPAGVGFVATWEPVELDADVIAWTASLAPGGIGATSDAPASPTAAPTAAPIPAGTPVAPTSDAPAAAGPTSVVATRMRSGDGTIALSVAAPTAPGSYMLDLEMRDSGGGALPSAEQADIPSVEVRVWGERAVSYDLQPSADGTGAVVSITNTGLEPIPAWQLETAPAANVPDMEVARSVVTITASTNDPTGRGTLSLATVPLPADLPPGASFSVDVPDISLVTGRTDNWLSASLVVLGDPTWLAAYASGGAWFTDPAPADPGPAETPPAAATPSPTPTPNPTPTPSASPTPAATPAPTPTPTATPTPAASTPVTTAYPEHSSAIAYRGSWGDAPYAGYIGGNVTWSKTAGSTATFTFTGSSVSWVGPAGPTRGLALVLLDGQPITRVSMWRSSFVARVVLFKHAFGTVGRHTLTIEVLSMPSHPYVAIDQFVVVS